MSSSRPLTPRRPTKNNNNNQQKHSRSNSGAEISQPQQQEHDPFVQLEDETEKSLHILQQLRDRHRSILSTIPEVSDQSRFRSAHQTVDNNNSSSTTTATNNTIKPSSIDWHEAPVHTLIELDEITDQTEELINDVSDDITLLKATVQKHVEGGASSFDAAYADVDSDEISRRVEIVHAFERKLRQSRNDFQQTMSKARDFRQMQLGDYATAYYEEMENNGATPLRGNYSSKSGNSIMMSPSPQVLTSRRNGNDNDNNGEDQNKNTNNNRTNDFAANFIKQEMQEQNKISAEHAIILDRIHVGVMSAEDKAKLINVALKESEHKLGFVDRQIDGIQGKLDSAVQATNKLLESTSERNKMILICVLTFILILLLFALFSGGNSSSSS